jgi:hypothetical protein
LTAKEIYEIGISYIPEVSSDNPDLQRYVVGWLNTMMLETFEVENAIRKWNNEEPLVAPQVIKNIGEEIVYHDALALGAFPYGIASYAFIDDDNDYRSNKFGQYYVRGVNAANKYIPHKIVDRY